MKKVLIVAAHPDDETLGCGGSILKLNALNYEFYWLIVTKPIKNQWSSLFIKKRNKQINTVSKLYNFKNTIKLNLPSTELDNMKTSVLIKKISKVFLEVKAEIAYIPFFNDIHTDHQILSKACLTSIKSFRNPYINKVLMYETLSETNLNFLNNNKFTPNYYENITNFEDEKIKIMNIYESEISNHPFPRSNDSIKSLAVLRGSESGYKYAESFQLVFERNK